jgi:hypothetical protein
LHLLRACSERQDSVYRKCFKCFFLHFIDRDSPTLPLSWFFPSFAGVRLYPTLLISWHHRQGINFPWPGQQAEGSCMDYKKIRAFRTTAIVAVEIEEDTILDSEDDVSKAFTIEALHNYLKEAVKIDWDNDGEDIGVLSMKIYKIEELTQDEISEIYSK